MFPSLKRLFRAVTGPAQPSRPTVTMRAGQIFQWHRGLRLQAAEDTRLALPGELIRNDEQIGSIIEVDHDADVGFQKRSDGTVEAIHMRLHAGHTVTLHRSSDVLLVARDREERVFYILSDNKGEGVSP